jgi:hypothetical protein
VITAAVCNSFKLELGNLSGTHRAGDVYKLALYTAAAALSKATTVYTPTHEVAPSGTYPAGGLVLRGFTAALDGDTVILDWIDPVASGATITARGALIYNSSKGNKAVAVLDFGRDVASTAAPFTVELPPAGAGTAVVRIA